MTAVHQQQIARRRAFANAPVHPVVSVQVVVLASERLLNPDFLGHPEKPLQFDDLDRGIWPVMMPADDNLAALGIMPVCPKVAGAILKLNPARFLTVSDKPVRKAVWKLRLNPHDAEFQAFGDVREEEDNPEFIHRRVFHRRISERNRCDGVTHGVTATPPNDRTDGPPPRRDNARDTRPPERPVGAPVARIAKQGGGSLQC